MEGRTYRYFRGEPLYPFGYGLSYTTFQLDNLQIAPEQVAVGGPATIRVDVTNVGDRAGDEVIQLYLRHPDSGRPRPIQALKAFARISLQPAERRTITFVLGPEQLGTYDDSGRYLVEPGTVHVMAGTSSRHLPLAGQLQIVADRPD
jgi:beta-glucosidase